MLEILGRVFGKGGKNDGFGEVRCEHDQRNPKDESAGDILNDREINCPGPGGIDAACERLVVDFGAMFVNQSLLDRIECVTGAPPHPFLRRGLFCAHRSFGAVLDAYEKGDKFYLYTGRGPSASMHVGHLLPFMFTAYLQRAFKVPVIIQMSDDEKFLYKGLSREECAKYMQDNLKDIIACGFDPERTFIFNNFDSMGILYPAACGIQRHLTCNQVRAVFGVGDSDSPAKMAFPAVQMAPALPSTFGNQLFGNKTLRCVVPSGIDQDPYFRVCRDVAKKMHEHKPSVLISKFLPALSGTHTKLSSSTATDSTGLGLADTPKQVRKKMNKAVSGGRESVEEHRRLGADLSTDVPMKYLRCFFPGPDAELESIEKQYQQGLLLSGEVKKLAADAVSSVLANHQKARAAVTDADIASFMEVRQLKL